MKNLVFLLLLVLMSAGSVVAQYRFVAALDGAQEVPSNASTARGTCNIALASSQNLMTITCTFSGLGSNATAVHVHGNAGPGSTAPPIFDLGPPPAATSGTVGPLNFGMSANAVANLKAHNFYVNIHSANFPDGEIRGQVKYSNVTTDYDGDGRSDPVIFRQSTSQFWIDHSLNNSSTTVSLGTGAGDNFLHAGDFDGDGRWDPFLLKTDASGNASWSIYQTRTNTVRNFVFGIINAAVGDTLAIHDYDGDGILDPAVFRRSTGDWWVIRSTSPGPMFVEHWGTANDIPAVGDYDGDGKADLTVVRPDSGNHVWWIRSSRDGTFSAVRFGLSTDGLFFFAPFDIDGDLRQDIAVNRSVSGQRIFHVLRSSDGSYVRIPWGLTTDTARFGDFDGDGKTDLVARRNEGGNLVWHILRSSDGAAQYYNWGIAGDQLTADSDYEEYVDSLVLATPQVK